MNSQLEQIQFSSIDQRLPGLFVPLQEHTNPINYEVPVHGWTQERPRTAPAASSASRHFVSFSIGSGCGPCVMSRQTTVKKAHHSKSSQQARKKQNSMSLPGSGYSSKYKTRTMGLSSSASRRNIIYAKAVYKPVPSHIVPAAVRSRHSKKRLGSRDHERPPHLEHRNNENVAAAKDSIFCSHSQDAHQMFSKSDHSIGHVEETQNQEFQGPFLQELIQFHNDDCMGCIEYQGLKHECELKLHEYGQIIQAQHKQIQSLTHVEDELRQTKQKQKELITKLRLKIKAALAEISSLRARTSGTHTAMAAESVSSQHEFGAASSSTPKSKFEHPVYEEFQERVAGDCSNFGNLYEGADLTTKIAALRTSLSARQALQNEIRDRVSKANEILNHRFGHVSTHPDVTIPDLQMHIKIQRRFVRWLNKFIIDGIHDIQQFEKTFIFTPARKPQYYYEGQMKVDEEDEEVEGIFIPLDVHRRAEAMSDAAEANKSTLLANKSTSTFDLVVLHNKGTFTFGMTKNPQSSSSTSDLVPVKDVGTSMYVVISSSGTSNTKRVSGTLTDAPKAILDNCSQTDFRDSSSISTNLPTFFSCEALKEEMNPAPRLSSPVAARSRHILTCSCHDCRAVRQTRLSAQETHVKESKSESSLSTEELYRRPIKLTSNPLDIVSSEASTSVESINERVNSVRQFVKTSSQESMEIFSNIERIKMSKSQINLSHLAPEEKPACEINGPETVETVIHGLQKMANEIVSNSSSEDSIHTSRVQTYESHTQVDVGTLVNTEQSTPIPTNLQTNVGPAVDVHTVSVNEDELDIWARWITDNVPIATTDQDQSHLNPEVHEPTEPEPGNMNASAHSVLTSDIPDANNNSLLNGEVADLMKQLSQTDLSDTPIPGTSLEADDTAVIRKPGRSRIPRPLPRGVNPIYASGKLSPIKEVEELPFLREITPRREKGKSLIPKPRSKSHSLSPRPVKRESTSSQSASAPSSRQRKISRNQQPSPRIPQRSRPNPSQKTEAPSKYDTQRPVFTRPISQSQRSDATEVVPPPPPPRARHSAYTTEYTASYNLDPFKVQDRESK